MVNNYFDYKNLIVWQKSMNLVDAVYLLTEGFPSNERFGLISQMQRASVSIPSNIAEGKTRRTAKDYRHFLIIASGSGAELETQLIICRNFHFGTDEHLDKAETILTEVRKMLSTMISNLS